MVKWDIIFTSSKGGKKVKKIYSNFLAKIHSTLRSNHDAKGMITIINPIAGANQTQYKMGIQNSARQNLSCLPFVWPGDILEITGN